MYMQIQQLRKQGSVQLQKVTPMIQALYQALQISVSLGSVSEIQSIKELLALPKVRSCWRNG